MFNLFFNELRQYQPHNNFDKVLDLWFINSDVPEYIIKGWGLFGTSFDVLKNFREEYKGHWEQ